LKLFRLKNLSKYSEHDRKIILLTDGQENEGGNYQVAAKEAMSLHGIPCEIFVIGIAQSEKAREKAKNLATDTNGQYINIKSKNYTKENLSNKFSSFKSQLYISTATKTGVVMSGQPTLSTSIPSVPDSINVNSNKKTSGTNRLTKQNTNPKEEPQTEEQSQTEEPPRTINAEVQQNAKAIEQLSKLVVQLQKELTSIKKETPDLSEDVIITEDAVLNEKIRLASESFVDSQLEKKFDSDTFNHHVWMNKDGESGQSFDFKIVDTVLDLVGYYVECKGTINAEPVFYLTKKEWQLMLKEPDKYKIYIVTEALSASPKLRIINNLLSEMTQGKVVPFSNKNIKLKGERIVMTVID